MWASCNCWIIMAGKTECRNTRVWCFPTLCHIKRVQWEFCELGHSRWYSLSVMLSRSYIFIYSLYDPILWMCRGRNNMYKLTWRERRALHRLYLLWYITTICLSFLSLYTSYVNFCCSYFFAHSWLNSMST